MGNVCTGILLVISGISVCMDLKWRRIANPLMGCGWVLGLLFHWMKWGWLGTFTFLGEAGFPILVWGIFYYFRMIGAGDIKLFSVLGGFLGIYQCALLMLWSVVLGGVLAAILMVIRRNFYRRLLYFQCYLMGVICRTGWRPYREGEEKDSTFHFTIPIFISLLLLLGGIL